MFNMVYYVIKLILSQHFYSLREILCNSLLSLSTLVFILQDNKALYFLVSKCIGTYFIDLTVLNKRPYIFYIDLSEWVALNKILTFL